MKEAPLFLCSKFRKDGRINETKKRASGRIPGKEI